MYEWKEEANYDIKPSIYIVRKDDSIKKIAKKFDISVEELKKLNNIIEIYPGQMIKIEK